MDDENKIEPVVNQGQKKYIFKLLISVIIIAAFFGALFGFMAASITPKLLDNLSIKNNNLTKNNEAQTNIMQQEVIQEDSAVIEVVEKSTPAVVSIIVSKDIPRVRDFYSNPFDFPFFFDPFGSNNSRDSEDSGDTKKQTIGGGSGFLITSDGMVVTNKHVVSDTSADYTVLTDDGQEHPAKVLARDPINDVAIIKIDGDDYPTLSFGNSDELKIGQTVIAIGNSLGEFSNTVSRGIVSGLKRNLTASGSFGESERLTNIIQTDAAINPGNSGGPLLNIRGEVIGVNVAIAQGAQNVGFALPANQIIKIINQVKATGKITLPYIGVRYIPVTKEIKKQNNLEYDYGALVLRGQQMTDFAVVPGSPADKAGLIENDIILEINGTKINESNPLADVISRFNVGDQVTLKVWHKGQIKEVSLVLEERK